MAEATSGTGKKKSKSKKKVGGTHEPCLITNPEKDLVVMVSALGLPRDGIKVQVTDAKKKKKIEVTTGGGVAVFDKLNAGVCTIETKLQGEQSKELLPKSAKATIVKGDFAEEVLKLATTSLEVKPSAVAAAPLGLFNSVLGKGEALRVDLSLSYGNPDALAMVLVKLSRNRADVEVFTDEACTQAVAFTDNVATLPREQFRVGTVVPVWVRAAKTDRTPLMFAIDVDPTARTGKPKKKEKADPSQVRGAPIALPLSWKLPVFTPAITAVTPLLETSKPFQITTALADPDKIAVTATLTVQDKDNAVVRELAKLDLKTTPQPDPVVTDWDGLDSAAKALALDKAPYNIVLDTTDRFGAVAKVVKPFDVGLPLSYLTLSFSDPDGTARALPKDFPVAMVFDDGTSDALKIGEKGALLGPDGKEGIKLEPRRKAFTLKFATSTSYIVCEPRGKDVAAALLKTADETKSWVEDKAPEKLDSRAFLLPDADWTLATSVWAIADDGARLDKATGKFSASGQPIGLPTTPAKLTLDPRWQYARITYQDRFRGGDAQVSSLPLFLEGYAVRPAATTDKPQTRSNWTTGADAEKAIQCLPWIIRATEVPKIKPDKGSELRFKTAKDTFIETPIKKEDPRLWSVGTAKAVPNADRVRFYDLPVEWRSHNWYVRKLPTGRDATGKFFFELDTVVKVLGKKDEPLIFSLDDIVLYGCPNAAKLNELTPLPALTATQPVAVFHRSFAKGDEGSTGDLSPEGIFLPVDAPAKGTLPKVEEVRWPASKDEVLVRAGTVGRPLLENYIHLYPDWARLVIAEGDLFDVFAYRSVADDTKAKDRVVGARAAVRFVAVADPIDNVKVGNATKAKGRAKTGASIAPRPPAVKSPFFAIQQLTETRGPIPNHRLDHATCATKGTASTFDHDFGARYGRASEALSEATAPATDDNLTMLGRYDSALIRCCGTEKDGTIEKGVQLAFHRLCTEFKDSVDDDDVKRGAWIQRTMTGLAKRWNGVDGNYNPGRVRIEPRDQAKRADKFSIEPVRVFQHVPLDLGAIRFIVIAKKPGARDYMSSWLGETQTQDGNEVPDTGTSVGRFTSAHELGHGAGLFDDYCELWNHASYRQPGVPMLVAGDPYIFDVVEGSESMMHGNKEVRERHFWQSAEWVHAQLPAAIDLEITRKSGYTFSLPHYAGNRVDGRAAYRSYLAFPWKVVLDMPSASNNADKARCDLYFWALGSDVFSHQILPGRSGDLSNQAYDALLIVNVSMCLNFDGLLDHNMMMNACAQLVINIRKAFSERVVASLEVNSKVFERCLIQISPRIIVGSHAGDEGYDTSLGLDKDGSSGAWVLNNMYALGDRVKPTVSNGFIYEVSAVDASGGPNTVGSGATEPAWPKSKDATVVDDTVTWKAIPTSEGRKPDYIAKIKEKLKTNPIHLTIDMTAATSELVTPATGLPTIRLAGQQLHLLKEALALEELYSKAMKGCFDAAEQEAVRTVGLYRTAETDKNRLEGERVLLVQQQTAADQRAIQGRDQYNILLDGNPLRDQALVDWTDGYNDYQRLAGEITTKTQERDAAQVRMNDAARDNRLANGEMDALRPVTGQGAFYGKLSTMAAALFLADVDPLTDAGYTELTTQVGTLPAAATQPNATLATVKAAITSVRAPAVALKEAIDLLGARTPPADVAALAGQFVVVATKLRDWAAVGATDLEKKTRAADAAKTLKGFADEAARAGPINYSEQIVKVDGGWSTLDYGKAKSIRLAEFACVGLQRWDLRDYFRKKSPTTLEEQVRTHLATFLGLSTDASSTTGYQAFVDAVADRGRPTSLMLPRPPTAPPPPITPPTRPSGSVVVPLPVKSLAEQLEEQKSKLKTPPPKPPPPPPPPPTKTNGT